MCRLPIDKCLTVAYGDRAMKRGIDERGPIAAWLIRSRALFRVLDADHTWTADEFLAALARETGHAPARTTYARWESGAARPEGSSLAPIIAFYAGRGVAGPEATAKAAEPTLAIALMALARELEEWRLERQSMRDEIDELKATVAAHDLRLRPAPSADGTEAQAEPDAPRDSE